MLMELHLDLEVPEAVVIAAGGGQRVNALFLDLVREANDHISSRLHDVEAPKPYTVSPLTGEMDHLGGGRLRLSPGRSYALRFTMLDDDLVSLWEEGLLPRLRGRRLRLGDAVLIVTGFRRSVMDADDLYRATIVSRKAPPRKLTLRFLSPTAFRSGGHNVLFPLPRMVWQSANRAWSAVSRVDLGGNLHVLAGERVWPARFNLSTHILHFDRSRQLGVVGSCEYLLDTDDDDLRRALHLLARFCQYCGLGIKTTMGMGQVRFGPDAAGSAR